MNKTNNFNVQTSFDELKVELCVPIDVISLQQLIWIGIDDLKNMIFYVSLSD
jgi:hypothetical protein